MNQSRRLFFLLPFLFFASLAGQTASARAQAEPSRVSAAAQPTFSHAANEFPYLPLEQLPFPSPFVRYGIALARVGEHISQLLTMFSQMSEQVPAVLAEEATQPKRVAEQTAVFSPSPQPTPPPAPTATPPPAQSYTVRHGDSFYRISGQFDVTVDALAVYNDLSLRSGLFAGMTLNIPPASFVPPPLNVPREGELFIWPVNSRGIVKYAQYGHMAIDIALPTGTPVQAVADGVVEFAGWHGGGYGNMVVVNHNNGWRSVYAHNSSLSVVMGQTVAQGEVLAESGNTGRSSMPHLHLEFSYNKVTKDPCKVLPVGC